MRKGELDLPLEISKVTRTNLMSALESVRGCVKVASLFWMRALGLPTLSGIVIRDWSKASAAAVDKFCSKGRFSELLLRIDKKNDRWSRRRGGFLVSVRDLPKTIKELSSEGRIAFLLEPISPYIDEYSLAGVTVPEQGNMIVEVVGPGFDASDILRGDIQPHERWQIELATSDDDYSGPMARKCIHLVSEGNYLNSVQARLAKIGARTQNEAFPDLVLQKGTPQTSKLAEMGASYLKTTGQTLLLEHADTYSPIPQKHLASFVGNVNTLLSGLDEYGIHLGPASFAAGVLPKRGLVFWDFFPAKKNEAVSLYPVA
jgi:hypothetical protein